MKASFRVRIEHLWLGLPIAILVWFSLLRPVGLLDFWWHLKAGEIIVTTRSIPRVDLFSFTCAGKPFVLQNWLVEVLYYAAYRAGGLALVIALNAALLVLALLPVYRLCYDAAGGPRLAALCVCLAVAALLTFGNVRSQAFSFACFSLTYWVLSAYRFRRRDALWTLPLLMVLWVNLHGAFVLGLALIALHLGAETVRRVVLGPRSNTLAPSELARLAAVLAVCVVATLPNPEGYRVYSAVTAVTRDPVSQAFVTEWQPPRIDPLGILAFHGPFFLSLLVLLCARARPDFTELALFFAFAGFALTSIRNAIWFALVTAPIVARYLPTIDATPALRSLRRFRSIDSVARSAVRRAERSSYAPVRYGVNRTIVAAMLLITICVSPWVRPHLLARGRQSLFDEKTPIGAIDYVQAHALRGHIFTPELYGDYLIWRLWPGQRSFVDSRVHLFQACPAVVDDYNLVFVDPRWEDRLSRYGVRYMLLDKDGRQNGMLVDGARASGRWRVLYEDEVSILFENERDGPA